METVADCFAMFSNNLRKLAIPTTEAEEAHFYAGAIAAVGLLAAGADPLNLHAELLAHQTVKLARMPPGFLAEVMTTIGKS